MYYFVLFVLDEGIKKMAGQIVHFFFILHENMVMCTA